MQVYKWLYKTAYIWLYKTSYVGLDEAEAHFIKAIYIVPVWIWTYYRKISNFTSQNPIFGKNNKQKYIFILRDIIDSMKSIKVIIPRHGN